MEETGDRNLMVEESQLPAEGVEFLCRLCGSSSSTVAKLFTDKDLCNDLGNKINLYLPVKVQPGDGLPEQCCWNCTHIVISWHDLYSTCKTTEEKLIVLQKVPSAKTIILEEPAIKMQHVVVKEEHHNLEDESTPQAEEDPQNKETISEEVYDKEALTVKPEQQNQDGLMESFEDSEGAERITCHICHKVFKNARSRYYHIRRIHVNEPKSKKVPCPICGLQREEKHMNLHITRKHSEDRPFACEVCGKAFKLEMDLRSHRVSHSNVRPFKCKLCPKTFKLKSSLRLHVIVHSEKKIFFCKLCGKKIAGRSALCCHIRQTHDMTKQQYDELPLEGANQMDLAAASRASKNIDDLTCNICHKTFKTKRIRIVHVKVVHEKQITRAKYPCPICGFLTLKSNLKEHLAKHSEERPFSCETCGKGFKLKRHLTRHTLIFHSSVGHNEDSLVT